MVSIGEKKKKKLWYQLLEIVVKKIVKIFQNIFDLKLTVNRTGK